MLISWEGNIMEQIYYIYKITNKLNNKVYIGQTVDPHRRWKEHRNANRSKKAYIHKIIQETGAEHFSFELIEETTNPLEREEFWIAYYKSNENGYNISIGRDGGQPAQLLKIITEYDNIASDLLYTKLTYNELHEKYGLSARVIRQFNEGFYERYDKQEKYFYPIRVLRSFSYFVLDNIQEELLNNTPNKEIEKKYQIGHQLLADINQGRAYYNSDYIYPLKAGIAYRLSTDRVRKIEEAILHSANVTEVCNKYRISRKSYFLINRGEHKNSTKTKKFPIRDISTCID